MCSRFERIVLDPTKSLYLRVCVCDCAGKGVYNNIIMAYSSYYTHVVIDYHSYFMSVGVYNNGLWPIKGIYNNLVMAYNYYFTHIVIEYHSYFMSVKAVYNKN